MDNNRYPITGVIKEIGESKQYSAYFKKRTLKLLVSDTEFNNKIVERKIVFSFINENCDDLDALRIDDTVTIDFYLDGKDIDKKDRSFNITSPVGYFVTILNSPSRESNETKNAVITPEGLLFNEDKEKEVTIDELMSSGPDNIDDPLLNNNTVINKKDLQDIDYTQYMVDNGEKKKDPDIKENNDEDLKEIFSDLPF